MFLYYIYVFFLTFAHELIQVRRQKGWFVYCIMGV